MEPINPAAREVRHPGQILMAQPLPAGQRLTVQPFDGGVMWTMPADSVQPAERQAPTQ
ncbi:hypothetical protein [Embleya sp. NBC_00896]|uniref:hypothetical protein n=1 Tax=Embleya sp. NBC_00896 TaxID=2975961 RepID=UPI00386C1A7B|nr:hypothetical protein OG928_17535 [Embleya sp. NBC_00896]